MALKSLKSDVFEYASRKIQLESLEKVLFESIRLVVHSEIPVLNSKLPEGYSIVNFHISSPDDLALTPKVNLTAVKYKGEYVDSKEFPKLNEVLNSEYRRIRDTHGFRIELLHYQGIV